MTGELEALEVGESRGNMFSLPSISRKIRNYGISIHLIFDFHFLNFLIIIIIIIIIINNNNNSLFNNSLFLN